MKFTFDWLLDHLQTDLPYEGISAILTSLGIEVEEVVDLRQKFQGFVVGYIKSTKPHPNADKLRVCEVDIGDQTLNIVCGAKNARSGIRVAVAKAGAVIPAFGEPLKQSAIRGTTSEGMMCSTEELLLDDDGIDGIMELSHDLPTGLELSQALNLDQVIFDVSITPNRADCFSVRGLARDLAAAGAGTLKSLPSLDLAEDIENQFDVEIRTPNCSFFSTLALESIAGETPDYIAKRLNAIGQRLIHFPVDIANYICFDIGQPLHIFDLDKLPHQIIVRESNLGEKLRTLNGEETILPQGAIVVSTDDGILSVAGIIGGESSAFSERTSNILIEGAFFDKVSIAKTGQALNIITDSRTRFERGIDPELTPYAVRYAAFLIASNGTAQGMSKLKTQGTLPPNKNTINLTLSKFSALSGLSKQDFAASVGIIASLGMVIKEIRDDVMVIESPSWRHDLRIEEDVIEEILRITGYDNIIEQELERIDPINKSYTIDKITDALVYNGYHEIKTFTFIDKKTALLFTGLENHVEIKDPATTEFSTMKPSSIASHLKVIRLAQNKSQRNSRIFEVGKRYNIMDSKINEDDVLTCTLSEHTTERTWRHRQNPVSVFDIKEDLERILNMTISGYRLLTEAPEYYHPGRSGTYIFQKDTVVAHFGEIHPRILKEMDVDGPVVCFEMFLDVIPEFQETKARTPLKLSQFQPTMRDFSFIVKKELNVAGILNVIKKLRLEYVKNVKVFDVYESEAIGADNKAVAVEVYMQSDDATLTDDNITDISSQLIAAVSKHCAGVLRK
ncbi:MAG: phenylalanine--tRNA ligase subunit beta [Holosporales bacterium]|nr:phenylalanine--tRNA ligase subunit beta [Holosporales bacterium]